jgi:hypothetical protein
MITEFIRIEFILATTTTTTALTPTEEISNLSVSIF